MIATANARNTRQFHFSNAKGISELGRQLDRQNAQPARLTDQRSPHMVQVAHRHLRRCKPVCEHQGFHAVAVAVKLDRRRPGPERSRVPEQHSQRSPVRFAGIFPTVASRRRALRQPYPGIKSFRRFALRLDQFRTSAHRCSPDSSAF